MTQTTASRPIEFDPNRPRGLYCYDTPPQPGARSWRPDLVPVLLNWMKDIPAADWQYCSGFAVDQYGAFVVHFEKIPRRGGPPRRVSFAVEHGTSSVQNDRKIWLRPDHIVPYSAVQLDAAVNVFGDPDREPDSTR